MMALYHSSPFASDPSGSGKTVLFDPSRNYLDHGHLNLGEFRGDHDDPPGFLRKDFTVPQTCQQLVKPAAD
jgi:hypothetical protein